MSIADTLDALPGEDRQCCTVGRTLRELGEQDRKALQTALDRHVSASAVVRVLRVNGKQLSQTSVLRHRRGECACS